MGVQEADDIRHQFLSYVHYMHVPEYSVIKAFFFFYESFSHLYSVHSTEQHNTNNVGIKNKEDGDSPFPLSGSICCHQYRTNTYKKFNIPYI